MKVLKGITLAFWISVMAACVSLVSVYYISSQTVLNPTTVKGWLNDSGAYGSIAAAVVPKLTTDRVGDSPAAHLLTTDIVKRAAKSSIKPETVKAKTEPIIDATYAWLDSKSPEITFSVPITDETDAFLAALRTEVLAKIKTLPECNGYVALEALESANCLPRYVTPETAADTVIERIKQRSALRDTALTQDSFKSSADSKLTDSIPDLISYFWVAQLIAMPVFAVVALFILAKRRSTGLIAIASSLFTPGLTLFVLGLVIKFAGTPQVEAFVKQSEISAVAGPLGRIVVSSLATVTFQVAGALLAAAVLLGGLGIWWRKRSLKKAI